MTDRTDQEKAMAEEAAADARGEWIAPAVTRMRSGNAEAGPNPVAPEGPLGMGPAS